MIFRWNLVAIVYFIVLVAKAKSQTCTCDLTANKCDINCCCDPDCTGRDRTTFRTCIPVEQNRLEEVCSSESYLFGVGGEYRVQGNSGGLFCVYKDNYQERSLYPTVSPVTSSSTFQTFVNKFDFFSYMRGRLADQSLLNAYKFGDSIPVIFTNNQQGYLSQPDGFLTEQCSDANNAQFLNSSKSQCTRVIANLQTQCNNEQLWKPGTFFQGFKVSPFPSFLSGGGNTSAVPNFNDTQLITPTLVRYQKPNGSIVNCTAQTYDISTGCNNVMLQASYDIGYRINITTEIVSVNVSFVLGTIPPNFTSFQQSFAMQFTDLDKAKIASNATVSSRSGNPGYVVGLPVIFGNITTNATSQEISSVAGNIFKFRYKGSSQYSKFLRLGVSNSEVYAFLNKSTIELLSLSLIKASVTGSCDDVNRQPSITFGKDYKSGCMISIEDKKTQGECEKLQNDILAILIQQLPTHVAGFGNTDTTKIDDWVMIINDGPTSQPGVSSGSCVNMITDVTFQLLYTKTGFFANPQNKVVGFKVQYGLPRSFFNPCFGLICPPPNSSRVEVSQAVSFIDVSSTPQVEVKPIPKFKSKAPNDFFYPFF